MAECQPEGKYIPRRTRHAALCNSVHSPRISILFFSSQMSHFCEDNLCRDAKEERRILRQKTGSLAVRSVNRASCRGSWHGGWKDKVSNTLKWRADPSAVGWMVPDVATLFGLLDPEDDGPRMLRNVYSHWPKITMSHTRRLDSSACTWHLSVAPLCLVDDTVFCCKEQRTVRSTVRLMRNVHKMSSSKMMMVMMIMSTICVCSEAPTTVFRWNLRNSSVLYFQ